MPPPAPATESPPPTGGADAGNGGVEAEAPAAETETEATPADGATTAPGAGIFSIPSLPSSSCAINGVPPVLIPIYQAASERYALGPQGPAILAGINAIETAFGTNLGPSSAGAVGWMQFMPETWSMYGVDANGDGVADPNNPEDAIYAAARYLSAAGMPADVWGAIFAYNHADWYVEEVLANAGCYAGEVGGAYTTVTLSPQIQVFECTPAEEWKKQIPADYLAAFEAAAGRYELGKRGVWTLAAIARLESNFGRGMSRKQLRTEGPLGLDRMEWSRYAVDGDKDGRLRHADIDDSAATLARMMWSRGGIDPGVFTHNQAAWYVDAVAHEAEQLGGKCVATTEEWTVVLPGDVASQINWQNLTLSNDLELRDIQAGLLDQRVTGLLALMTKDHQITITAAALRPLADDRLGQRLQPLLRPGDGHRLGRRRLLHRHLDHGPLRPARLRPLSATAPAPPHRAHLLLRPRRPGPSLRPPGPLRSHSRGLLRVLRSGSVEGSRGGVPGSTSAG